MEITLSSKLWGGGTIYSFVVIHFIWTVANS